MYESANTVTAEGDEGEANERSTEDGAEGVIAESQCEEVKPNDIITLYNILIPYLERMEFLLSDVEPIGLKTKKTAKKRKYAYVEYEQTFQSKIESISHGESRSRLEYFSAPSAQLKESICEKYMCNGAVQH
ncbi:unnamed protein product [Anisakis simplex]|uniref:Uncharacterized protein n=1 Tax=Anisakis simplex TaxID=6269 RepID=A0A3P6TI78_ANISI|nr:unnamed protein product [Anisakis simplex]